MCANTRHRRTSVQKGKVSSLEKFFRLKENGTTVKREIVAGVTTFVTMAYIIALAPDILSQAGMEYTAVFTATCLATIIGTLIMALWAKMPFALAPGVGPLAFFTYTVCLGMGMSWQFALTAVLIEGVLFLLMSFFNIRESIVNLMPKSLKNAVSVGVGLFIALIGLKNGGVVLYNEGTGALGMATFSFADVATPAALVTVFGILLIGILLVLKVPGALLIGVAGSTVLSLILGVAPLPTGVFSLPPSITPIFFQFEWAYVFTVEMAIVVFTFLFTDVFDTIGTLVGVTTKAKMIDKDGNVPNVKQALTSDAVATVAGSMLGTPTVTTYVESASGVAAGGRTGLTSLTTAACFVLALFFSPLVLIVPSAATAPALVMVGVFMMAPITDIDFSKYNIAIPAFFAVTMMAFTYDISTGIGCGFITYTILNFFGSIEDRKTVNPMLIIVSLLFLVKFIIGAL